MKSKKIVFSLIAATMVVSLSAIVGLNFNQVSLSGSGCQHEGNHYTQLDNSKTQSGTKEYWVCCKCKEHFLTLPQGQFEDAGVASAITDYEDDRYLPRLLNSAYHVSVENEGKINEIEHKEIHTFINKTGDSTHIVCESCGYEMEKPTEGVEYKCDTSSGTCSFVGYANMPYIEGHIPEHIAIASVYNGYPVTKIANSAFCYDHHRSIFNEYIKTVSIPDSVEIIESNAFMGNEEITSIILPDSIKSIGDTAFSGCTKLSEIYLPDDLINISPSAFDDSGIQLTNKNGLSYLSKNGKNYYYLMKKNSDDIAADAINDKTKVICAYTFMNCTFNDIYLPSGIISIGKMAFTYCNNLTKVVLPEDLEEIQFRAFALCDNLESVYIPKSLKTIGEGAFAFSNKMNKIFYEGTSEDWNEISIHGWGNEIVNNATRYYYSPKKPTTAGNYWHYVNDEITIWSND